MESDSNIPIQQKPMDWRQIIKSLVQQTGNEDMVQQLMLDFLTDENQLGFDPKAIREGLTLEEGLKHYLSGVAKNRVKDCGRSSARDRSRLLPLDKGGRDDDRPFEGREIAGVFRSPADDLMATEFGEGLIGLIQGDTEAEKVIKAALEISGRGRVHQELAESAFGDAAAANTVRNAIKRIRRAVENKERNGENLPWMIRTATLAQNSTTDASL